MNESIAEAYRAISVCMWDALYAAAQTAISTQDSDGHMPPGHNGPHADIMTPVRNTAHWLQLFGTLADRYGNPDYLRAANKCAHYLCSDKARPGKTLFKNRIGGGKDPWNGLIGQVWALEALLFAGTCLDCGKSLDTFFDVLEYVPFDESAGLWRICPEEGDSRVVLTLNQQIGMASVLARAINAGYETYRVMVETFLDKLACYIRMRDGAVFRQMIAPRGKAASLWSLFRLLAPQNIRLRHHVQAAYRRVRYGDLIDLGYHAFTLFGLSQIKKAIPAHIFWTEHKLSCALETAASRRFLARNTQNPFGGGYHLIGIETAFSLLTFGWGPLEERKERICSCIGHDLKTHFDDWSGRVAIDVTDEETATARLYEAAILVTSLEEAKTLFSEPAGQPPSMPVVGLEYMK